MPVPSAIVPSTVVNPNEAGQLRSEPPTFLEKSGVLLLGILGGWILLVSTVLILWFLTRHPVALSVSQMTMEQAREAIASQKLIEDQWRDSMTFVFDLTVTKTALPVVTLLLGYLFGRARANG